jgi:tripartite-type tricarboxylate transporter receptor subunit TctC
MKKQNLLCLTMALVTYVAGWQASAQEWSQRPIRIIVAFGAGGGADIIGRILGQAMQDKLEHHDSGPNHCGDHQENAAL